LWGFGGGGKKKNDDADVAEGGAVGSEGGGGQPPSEPSLNFSDDNAFPSQPPATTTTTTTTNETLFSSEATTTTAPTSSSSSSSSVEETLDRLFQEQQTAGDPSFAADPATTTTTAVFDPTWYNPADQAINALNFVHDITGLEYGWSIIALTAGLRIVIFPAMAYSRRTTSRMAHANPEIMRMKAKFERISNPTPEEKVKIAQDMQAVFKRFGCKPFTAFLSPLISAPAFMGMFFGMKKMPQFYADELATGGMFWFVDLTAPDPLYVLPFACFATFLATIEMGKEELVASNPAQGQVMLNVFRGMSIIMIPVCMNFHAAMLCYWTTNNVFTAAQTLAFKTPAFRKKMGIWDPPKPVPGEENDTSFKKAAGNLVKSIQGKPTTEAQKIAQHNRDIEHRKQVDKARRSSSFFDSSSSRRSPARRRNRRGKKY